MVLGRHGPELLTTRREEVDLLQRDLFVTAALLGLGGALAYGVIDAILTYTLQERRLTVLP